MNAKLFLIASGLFATIVPASINMPEAPATQDFTSTSIKDFSKADPSEGIILMPAPLPNHTGSATTSFPIKLPPGRQGFSPNIEVSYNSDGGHSWLGQGWMLDPPAISVETRWGVPRYDASKETETYLLEGEQLGPVAHRKESENRIPNKVFHLRVEGNFSSIIRNGASPADYWWEVIDKEGTHYFYGGVEGNGVEESAVLRDDAGNITQWNLVETKDRNDNFIRYHYVMVEDTGVQGGILPGREIYLDYITYTGHRAVEGPYKVSFKRDRQLGENKRIDIAIDASAGFKRVTADLLRKIEVTYRGELIRSYDFTYQQGSFFKTLLAGITAYDKLGAPFYTHTMEYYNDVNEGGQFRPLANETSWSVTNDEVRGGIVNPIPGFDGKTSLLGGAKSDNFDVGSAITVGPIGNLVTKTNTAGGSFSYAESNGEGLLALVDINGDGLPDKLFSENGALYYRPNLVGKEDGETTFGGKRLVRGVKQFSHSKTRSTTLGAEAHPGPLFVGYENTKSKTTTDTYFSDFNGDGLIDIANKGRVYFNHIDENGDPVFTNDSGDTPSPIFAEGTLDQDAVGPTPAELEALMDEFPLHDVVRMWEAPYAGVIVIQAPVQLINDGADYPAKDGVKVSIQHKGNWLWQTTIAADDYGIKTPTGTNQVNIQKGDRIYFRVQSLFDGAFDRVAWDPEIIYQDIPASELDANGLQVGRFKASEDFLLSSCQSVSMTLDGRVRVEGKLLKPLTSDDLTLAIEKTDANGAVSIIYSTDISGAEATEQDIIIEDLPVKTDDELLFKLTSTTNVDWAMISWVPRLYYTSADDGSAVFSANGSPLFDFCPSVAYSMFNEIVKRSVIWEVQDTGLATITPTAGNFTTGLSFFTLSVKKVNKLLGKVSYLNNTPLSNTPLSIPVSLGDSLYIEYHVSQSFLANPPNNPTAAVSLNGQTTTVEAGLFAQQIKEDQIFGPQYRGWGQFIYNGNRGRADIPIDEASLHLDDGLMDVDTTINYENPEDLEGDFYDPTKAIFISMIADPKSGAWLGYDNLTYITKEEISSSRMGEDNLLPLPTSSEGSGASAPNLLSETTMNSVAGGAGFGAVSGSGGSSWTSLDTKLDMMDMNGDRYPDVVTPRKIQYTTTRGGLESRTFAHNLGTHEAKSKAIGFTLGGAFVYSRVSNAGEARGRRSKASKAKAKSGGQAKRSRSAAKTAASSIGISGNFGDDGDETVHTWLDINGDGLTDKVYPDGKVALNLGYRFAPLEQWGYQGLRAGKSVDYGGGAGVNIANGSIAAGFSLSRTDNYVTHDLDDLNGDGLVDMIVLGDPLKVRLNTGNGFGPEMNWPGINKISDGTATGESVNAAFTVCVPIFFVRVCFNPSTSVGQGVSREFSQFEDIDGDGFPDFLMSQNDGELKVKKSTIGRTNLLKKVNRPLGAAFTLDYDLSTSNDKMARRKWVLSTVLVDDGFKGDGADQLKSRFVYQNGYFDRHERAFYGFGTVMAHQLDTESGDAIYRTAVYTYANQNFYTKGLLLSEVIQDAEGNKYVETRYDYQLKDIETGSNLPPILANDDAGAAFPAMVQTTLLYYEGQTEPGLQRVRTYAYDAIGNIIREVDFGNGTAGDQLTIETTYHDLADKYIKSMPAESKYFTQDGLVRHRTTTLDGSGNPLEIRQYLEDGTAAQINMDYDQYGNIIKLVRPENHQGERMYFDYTYDEEVQTYVTRIEDAYGYHSENKYEFLFGQLLETKDLNEQRTIYTYDERGRMTTLVSPYEWMAGKPYTMAFEYFPDAAVPYAKTRHYDPEHGDDILFIHFMDGLQRDLQDKQMAARFKGDGQTDESQFIVSGEELYDAFGRVVKRYYPITEPLGSEGVLNPNIDNVPPTEITYDILDRERKTRLPDGTEMEFRYEITSDNAGQTRFKTITKDPLERLKDTYTDVRGNVSATVDYGPEGEIWTHFTYNPLSELLVVTDDFDNETVYTYDQFGRRTSTSHPAAGLTEFFYDLSGNMTKKVTPVIRQVFGQDGAIHYSYDHERLTKITYPENIQNNVRFHYGEAGAPYHRAGRVWLQEDASGGQEYFFGPYGEVNKEIRTLIINSTIVATYVSTFEYDGWGRIQKMVYPDGEAVDYQYNRAGQLQGMKGEKLGVAYAYVDQIGYDKFGEKVFLKYGNGTRTSFAYEPERRRLSEIKASTRSGKQLMDNEYEYDPMNNILAIQSKSTAGIIGGNASHQYAYDRLYRLQKANGQWKGIQEEATYSLDMQYDNLYNIIQQTQQHSTGNLSNSPQDFSKTYLYEQGSAYAPTKVGEANYTFDANGNVTYIKDEKSTQQFIWDEENRLSGISDDGYISLYTYDAGGDRVIKSHGGIQGVFVNGLPAGIINHNSNYTAYVSPYFVAKKNSYSKHYYIEGERIASKIGTGKFSNNLLPSGQGVVAGNIDYKLRLLQIQQSLLAYYDSLGIPPGPPTLPGYYAQPEFTGSPLPSPPESSPYTAIPENWPLPIGPPDTSGPPGPPVWITDNRDEVEPPYGYEGLGIYEETEQFFYHPDHLGSNNYLSDYNGEARQFATYLPFGGLFVEEQVDGPQQSYLYNGKELDRETGLYYYGARYYDPTAAIWFGVDPQAAAYPGISPYAYVANNPVLYTDPDGERITIRYGKNNEKKIEYKYGARYKGNDPFVKDVVASFDYLRRGGVGTLIKEVTGHRKNVTIVRTKDLDGLAFHPRGHRIYYHPRSGLKTEEGGKQSPALGLLHELGHAKGYIDNSRENNRLVDMHDSHYDNLEEKRVIKGIENPAARKLGEATRKGHGGSTFRTTGPTSTKRPARSPRTVRRQRE
ncbi:MAG: SpvB/TcaC N-terminal domain-containing protein [Saprospiraceae bacterium]